MGEDTPAVEYWATLNCTTGVRVNPAPGVITQNGQVIIPIRNAPAAKETGFVEIAAGEGGVG